MIGVIAKTYIYELKSDDGDDYRDACSSEISMKKLLVRLV